MTLSYVTFGHHSDREEPLVFRRKLRNQRPVVHAVEYNPNRTTLASRIAGDLKGGSEMVRH